MHAIHTGLGFNEPLDAMSIHSSDLSKSSSSDNAEDCTSDAGGENVFWNVIGSSVPGRGHLQKGLDCEDAFAFSEQHDGIFIGAVADGAGSRSLGGEGARIAVQHAVKVLRENPPFASGRQGDVESESGQVTLTSNPEDALHRVLKGALEAIAEHAELQECSVGDLACTLILVVATHSQAAGVQVGDGASVLLVGDKDGPHHIVLTSPQQGEYANETYFLTSEGRAERPQTGWWIGDVRGVALFTDGLQRMVLSRDETCIMGLSPRPNFISPLYRYTGREVSASTGSENLTNFLQSEKISSKTHDDMTLVIAHVPAVDSGTD